MKGTDMTAPPILRISQKNRCPLFACRQVMRQPLSGVYTAASLFDRRTPGAEFSSGLDLRFTIAHLQEEEIMIRITAGRCDPWWFGVAWAGEDLVATTCGTARDSVLRGVERCLPKGSAFEIVEELPDFAAGVVAMLCELERGNEEMKQFTLSEEYLSEPVRRILTAAAGIPIGCVSTYGNIAKAVGSEARAVGRVMATNPLYPIVPCHRVVGADMTLVGYGGRHSPEALAAKLDRLEDEARSVQSAKRVGIPGSELEVYPVERVIEVAKEEERLRAEREAADRMQLRLF